MILLASVLPAINFELSDWKLQLPVDTRGEHRGTAASVADLDNYSSNVFFTGPDGAMVLRAPVDGATTKNGRYARTELREMSGDEPAAWSLEDGGHLAVALRVNEVPHRLDGGETRIVIGQVHGGDSQLIRLYYGGGSLSVVNGRNEMRPQDLHFNLLDANGDQPRIDLDEPFTYSFEVDADEVTVTVVADGTTYRSRIPVGEGWEDNGFYFKAGLYLGADETTATGWGQVSIYGLSLTHDGTTPALDLPKVAPDPVSIGPDTAMASLEDVHDVEPLDAHDASFGHPQMAGLVPVSGAATFAGMLMLSSILLLKRGLDKPFGRKTPQRNQRRLRSPAALVHRYDERRARRRA